MKYLIKKDNEIPAQDYGYIKVKQLLNQKDIENLSVAVVEINGKNKKIVNKKGDAIYYVLKGSGFFEIDGHKNLVEQGDLIFIPKGSEYFDSGNLTMISINNPRYDSKFIEYLEDNQIKNGT